MRLAAFNKFDPQLVPWPRSSAVEQPATVYSDSRGLYAGAAIKGGSIWPDTDANLAYYGQPLSAKEILFDAKVKPTAAAEELAQKITESCK